MSIYEYNEEYVKKTLYEDGYDSGRNDGMKTGYDSGKDDGISLGMELGNMKMLVNNVETVMKNLQVDLASACQILAISVDDYQEAKNKLIQS